jgi:hypothetical protein
MTLDGYINSKDPNEFWKLSSGDHQNLLDEAIERIQENEKEIAMFHNLLTTIHRDGGHYIEKHGIQKAYRNAVNIIYNLIHKYNP